MGWSSEKFHDVKYRATLTLTLVECPECGREGNVTASLHMPKDEYATVELPCGCEIYIGTLDNVTIGWR